MKSVYKSKGKSNCMFVFLFCAVLYSFFASFPQIFHTQKSAGERNRVFVKGSKVWKFAEERNCNKFSDS